jgi:hypothetical protein
MKQLFLSRSLKSPYPDTVVYEDEQVVYLIYTGQISGGRDYRILESGIGAIFINETRQGHKFTGTVFHAREILPKDELRRFMLGIRKASVAIEAKTKQELASQLGYRIRDIQSGIMDADKTDFVPPNPTNVQPTLDTRQNVHNSQHSAQLAPAHAGEGASGERGSRPGGGGGAPEAVCKH